MMTISWWGWYGYWHWSRWSSSPSSSRSMTTRCLPQSSRTPSNRHSGRRCLEAKSMAWNNIRWVDDDYADDDVINDDDDEFVKCWWWITLSWFLLHTMDYSSQFWLIFKNLFCILYFVMISLCSSRWITHTDKTASLVRWVSQATIIVRKKHI